MKIGGIEFPEGFTAQPCEGLFIVAEGGDLEPVIGWKFKGPMIPDSLIVQIADETESAKTAYKWFQERGHIAQQAKYRLVAYIFPKSSWGIQDDATERPRIASQSEVDHPQFGLMVVKTGPPRDDPGGLMIYDTESFHLPSQGKLERWQEFSKRLNEAIEQPILHREDFTYISKLD
jgi:hypothetical protein